MVQVKEQAGGMTPLVRLVRDRLDELGGFGNIRGFAKERGIAYTTLQYYLDPNLQLDDLPRRATLEKLARVLELPLADVQKAAVLSVGHLYREVTPDGEILMATFEQLSEAEKQAWVEAIYPTIKKYLP